jgi:hypothetical protein
MKLISNKVAKRSDSDGDSSQRPKDESEALATSTEVFDFQYNSVEVPPKNDGVPGGTQSEEGVGSREVGGDQRGGEDGSELTFVFNDMPAQSLLPVMSSGALIPLSPAEVNADSSSGGSAREGSNFHHQVTWQMLHLLATKVGKFKAANGSIMSVSLIGVEAGLGDVIQVEMVNPEIGGTHYVAVILANDKKVEVLGAQQTLLMDLTAFQEVRQFVATGGDVAQAIWEVQEIELRRMGQKAVDAFEQTGELPVPSW